MVVKYVQEVSDSKMNNKALGMAGEYCVVPENIHPPPPLPLHGGSQKFLGVGGSKRDKFLKGRGVHKEFFSLFLA